MKVSVLTIMAYINNPDNWVDFETPYVSVDKIMDILATVDDTAKAAKESFDKEYEHVKKVLASSE